MKIIERVLFGIGAIGLFSAMISYPFGNELLIISLGTLSLIYMLGSFFIFNNIPIKKIINKNTYLGKTKKLILSKIVGYLLAILVFGILFKFMSWPFSTEMLLLSVPLSLIALVFCIYLYSKNKTVFYKNTIFRLSIWFVIGLFMLNVSTLNILEFRHKNNPKLIEEYKKYIENQTEENEIVIEENK